MRRNGIHVVLRWLFWYVELPAGLSLVLVCLLGVPLSIGFWCLGFLCGGLALKRAFEVGLLILNPVPGVLEPSKPEE